MRYSPAELRIFVNNQFSGVMSSTKVLFNGNFEGKADPAYALGVNPAGQVYYRKGNNWVLYATPIPPTLIASFITVAHNHVDDAAAAIGGIAVGGLYHTAGAVKIRLS